MKRSTGASGRAQSSFVREGRVNSLYMPARPGGVPRDSQHTQCDVTPLPDSGQCNARSALSSMKWPSAKRGTWLYWNSFNSVAWGWKLILNIKPCTRCRNLPFASSELVDAQWIFVFPPSRFIVVCLDYLLQCLYLGFTIKSHVYSLTELLFSSWWSNVQVKCCFQIAVAQNGKYSALFLHN